LSFHELKTQKGIPFSRVWIRTLMAEGNFPKQVQLGAVRVAWIEARLMHG
jgi:predicted DNA-binding transcriptional regulator AlpA